MDRRDFCRTAAVVGGTLMMAPLLATDLASSAPEIAPANKEEPMATIALIKTGDRADGVRRALALLGGNPVQGRRVLLKPNFNSADEAPGSTHTDVLRALVVALQERGAGAMTIADRSGMGDTRRVMQHKGVFGLAQEFGCNVTVLDELAEREWITRHTTEHHWAHGFAVPRLLLEAECVVQTCNLKTHRYGGHFTLSLKNTVGFAAKATSVGGYNYMHELHNSPYQRHMIAELNTAYTPALIIMDGVEAFVTGGPDKGKMVRANVVLAGTDRIAMDAVGVALLRLFGTTPEVSRGPIFAQDQIARAVELGLGVTAPAQIAIVTADAPSEAYAQQIRGLLLA